MRTGYVDQLGLDNQKTTENSFRNEIYTQRTHSWMDARYNPQQVGSYNASMDGKMILGVPTPTSQEEQPKISCFPPVLKKKIWSTSIGWGSSFEFEQQPTRGDRWLLWF